MGEAFIVRKGGAAEELVITGQEVISGKYGETIAKFDTVFGNFIPALDAGSNWEKINNKLANPATLPTNLGNGTAFSTDGTYLAVAHSGSPFITIYKRSGDTFTKLTNPSTLPAGPGNGTAFSADGTYLAVAHGTTPFITIYKRSGDTFTKLTNPSTLPNNAGQDAAFSADGTYLAVGALSVNSSNQESLFIYKRSGDTFNILTEPNTQPPFASGFSMSNATAFSTDGTYLAVAHAITPFISIYKRSSDTFTKLTNPSTLPADTGRGVAFSDDGTYLAVGHSGSPFITIYKRSGDTFTKLTNPATLPTGDGFNTAFTTDGTYLAVAHTTTPFITIYKRSGDTFTKVPNSSELPTGNANSTAFSTDGTYLAVAYNSSPFINIYKTTVLEEAADAFTEIVKADNSLTLAENTTDIGYALEDGTEGQTKTMMSLFREEE